MSEGATVRRVVALAVILPASLLAVVGAATAVDVFLISPVVGDSALASVVVRVGALFVWCGLLASVLED